MFRAAYLRLDSVQTSEPEDLASPHLHLGVVDLVGALRQLLLVHLLLRGAVTGFLQELQAVGGDGGDQLILNKDKNRTVEGSMGHRSFYTTCEEKAVKLGNQTEVKVQQRCAVPLHYGKCRIQ